MKQSTYWRWQILMVLALAVTFAMPHVIHAVRNPAPSLPLMFSTDDGQYQARIRAALLHRWKEVRNGMIGGKYGDGAPKGASPALLEGIVGAIASPFGLHAPEVTIAIGVFLTPLVVFFLAGLLRAIGFSLGTSLLGTAAYVFLFLTPLQKPINMSLSLPYTILTLLFVLRVSKRPTLPRVTVAGVLLGLLPWTYFWGWTYAWAVAGWFVVLHALTVPASSRKRAETSAFLGMAAIALMIASIYFIDLWFYANGHPDFAATAARSTIIHSRGVESVPRFILATVLLISSLLLVRFNRVMMSGAESMTRVSSLRPSAPLGMTARDDTLQKSNIHLFPLSAVLGMYTAMYQNFLHGVIFTFSSHYYPYVCLTALIAVLWVIVCMVRVSPFDYAQDDTLAQKNVCHGERSRTITHFLSIVTIAASIPFLLAAALDYRDRVHHMLGNYHVRDVQHLAPAVQILDDGKRATVLTDRVSAHAITAWTDDDAVFTPYVRHVLVSDHEYAERYCLTELMHPEGPDIDWLAHEVVEVPNEEDYALRRAQFKASCAPVRLHPDQYLAKYGVTKLLWNERLRPEWKIDRSRFTAITSGSGWSLWQTISVR